jgi:hypothetical protein
MCPILARPDNGPISAETATVPAATGWLDGAWTWITNLPAWVAPATLAGVLLAALVTFPVLRAQARKAGERTAGATLERDRKDRQLLVAALVPAVLFWLAVLTGSARGLIAFGRDNLHWHDGWEYLVPFTLDGVAVSFGVLAFRAIRKERNPDRATRIAWGAMIASAAIQYGHEAGLIDGSALGGGYLALLSLLGMLIFHEFLGQFEDGAAWIKRDNPKFGMRWLTWPTNTACAWFAWRNYPPAEGTKATVGNAVGHLEGVRRAKAQRRTETVDAPAWWTVLAPWARISQLATALAEQRSTVDAERALRENVAADVQRLLAEHDTAIRDLREQHRRETELLRSEAAEQIDTLRAEHAAHVSRIRDRATTAPAGAPARTSVKTAPSSTASESRLSNDEAVELMLKTHPEPGYEWGTREVNRLTGAGFGRVPKLIAAVREHHVRQAGAAGRNTPEDDKEQAS